MNKIRISAILAMLCTTACAANVSVMATRKYVSNATNAVYTAAKGYVDAAVKDAGNVQSVNGKTGAVVVTAAQLGALTAESDPVFAAWTNEANIALGYSASADGNSFALGYSASADGNSFALGYSASASESSFALGYSASASESSFAFGSSASAVESGIALGSDASASYDGVAFGVDAYASEIIGVGTSATPDGFYLGSLASDSGSTARTLQSYLDERLLVDDMTNKVSEAYQKFEAGVQSVWTNKLCSAIDKLDPETATPEDIVIALQSIYARFYTVKYVDNTGDGSVTKKVREGRYAKEPAKPTSSTSTFLGWYASGATNAFDFAGTPITNDVTLTAKWKAN